jgi:hypothetical protein
MRRSSVNVFCLLALALALALAACSSISSSLTGKAEPEVNPNAFPANYKQEIIDTLTHLFDDPTNVHDAYISDPILRKLDPAERYIVCIRSNSRNVAREYTGSKDRIAYFYGGHLNQLLDASKEQCGSVAYKPFPELEKLCLAKKCE